MVLSTGGAGTGMVSVGKTDYTCDFCKRKHELTVCFSFDINRWLSLQDHRRSQCIYIVK